MVVFGVFPRVEVFKTRVLGRCFHILMNGVSFSPPTDVGSHHPSSPFRTNGVLADTHSLLQSMWDPQFTSFEVQCSSWHTISCPLSSRLSLARTSPCFLLQSMWDPPNPHLLPGPVSLLAHYLVSTLFGA